jgi:hypothetical protein
MNQPDKQETQTQTPAQTQTQTHLQRLEAEVIHVTIDGLLASKNPTNLEIGMAADLTAMKISLLARQQELSPEVFGRLFYISQDCVNARTQGRPLELWRSIREFWFLYNVKTQALCFKPSQDPQTASEAGPGSKP